MQKGNQDVGKALSNLILPKHIEEEAKRNLANSFRENLDKRIDENQNKQDPYFISYHETDDRVTGKVNNCWVIHDKMPHFLARQIVYWVDNKKGFKEWLWTINDDRKPFFNVEGVKKAKKNGALRTK